MWEAIFLNAQWLDSCCSVCTPKLWDSCPLKESFPDLEGKFRVCFPDKLVSLRTFDLWLFENDLLSFWRVSLHGGNWECAECCAALTGEALAGANNRSALLATSESVSFKVAIAYCNPKKQAASENIFGWSPFGSNLLHEARTLPHNGHCFSGQNNFQSHLSIREISVSIRRCQYAPVFFFRFEKPVKVFSLRDKHFVFPKVKYFMYRTRSGGGITTMYLGIWFR